MKLDLTNIQLFEEDEINFDKKVNYIYGPNGTGKSTIANECNKVSERYDVYIFQGFDSVISDDETLNAIVLGSKNVEINDRIKEIDKLIEEKKNDIQKVKETVTQPNDDKRKNFWTVKKDKVEEYNLKENEIEKIYKSSASKIKNMSNPQIVSTNYNRTDFKSDISKAALLGKDDIKLYKDTLNVPVRIVKDVAFPNIDAVQLKQEVNELIEVSLEEPIKIDRINNDEKREFADIGRRIHKKGDSCAFCGNKISDEVFQQLDVYFLADSIQEYQNKLRDKVGILNELKERISELDIEPNEFYPEYKEKAENIKKELSNIKFNNISFIEKLISSLEKKNKGLFEPIQPINLDTPEDFETIIGRFNKLKSDNNNSNLEEKQQLAKEKLRFHYVKEQLNANNYERLQGQLQELEKQKNEAITNFEREESKIGDGSELRKELNNMLEQRAELEKQTISETLLVDNINSKIGNMVSFKLHHQNNGLHNGIYNIEDKKTGEIRPIHQLSTGEKNIIAFLYFIEKLNEINPEQISNKPKLVVFDDPMSSNDDGMQYLIMEEITALKKRLNSDDLFVLLTHNKHFYINVSYEQKREDKYKKNNFFHLQSINNLTKIIDIVDYNKDFSTSYESLWKELQVLYDYVDASPELLLNPIRRIIETYLKFNVINPRIFYKNGNGAKKLFDVNSHSIDDLDAELNGKSKEELINLLKECFIRNNAESHFDAHWTKS